MLSTIIYDAIARLIGHQALNEVVSRSIILFGHHIIGLETNVTFLTSTVDPPIEPHGSTQRPTRSKYDSDLRR